MQSTERPSQGVVQGRNNWQSHGALVAAIVCNTHNQMQISLNAILMGRTRGEKFELLSLSLALVIREKIPFVFHQLAASFLNSLFFVRGEQKARKIMLRCSGAKWKTPDEKFDKIVFKGIISEANKPEEGYLHLTPKITGT
jgi:hypothetical protein